MTSSSPAATVRQEDVFDLKRAITAPRMLLFILGDVLGAGVYVLIGQIAGEVGGAVWAPLLLALCFAMFTAFSYAELVTKYPRAGGAAVFVQRAFRNPWLSFLTGFAMMSAAVMAAASLAVAFAGDYLAQFVTVPSTAAGLVFIGAVALLNLRGIEESMRVNVVLTIIEISGLGLAIVLGWATVAVGGGEPAQALQFPADMNVPLAILGGSVLAFYAFQGFETSANMAEEAIDPRRTYPRALLSALAIAGIVYLLVGLPLSMAVPVEALATSSGPLLEITRAAPIAFPPWLFSLIALLAVSNGALLFNIAASRLLYGMARENLLPSVFASLLPNRRTPPVAIAVTTLLAMALIATGSLRTLAETTVLLLVVVYLAVNASVLALRRQPVDVPHFRAPTIMPVLGLLSCLLVLTQQTAATLSRAGLLLLGGVALCAATRFAYRRQVPAGSHSAQSER
jgi:APA family basic amino acid/polyamine antiporter